MTSWRDGAPGTQESSYEQERARRLTGETQSMQVRREAHEDFNRAISAAIKKEREFQGRGGSSR